MGLKLDRRTSFSSGVFSAGSTTWTLPYSVATDGSEGIAVVVRQDTGAVVASTRPSATTVAVTGDLSAVAVTIGIQYTFSLTLSALYLRDKEGKAETRGRTQVRSITPLYGATRDFTVTVTPQGRAARATTVALSVAATGEKRVPVDTENEQATIVISNSTPNPTRLTGLDWEGFYHTRGQRV